MLTEDLAKEAAEREARVATVLRELEGGEWEL